MPSVACGPSIPTYASPKARSWVAHLIVAEHAQQPPVELVRPADGDAIEATGALRHLGEIGVGRGMGRRPADIFVDAVVHDDHGEIRWPLLSERAHDAGVEQDRPVALDGDDAPMRQRDRSPSAVVVTDPRIPVKNVLSAGLWFHQSSQVWPIDVVGRSSLVATCAMWRMASILCIGGTSTHSPVNTMATGQLLESA
jgi:hypothetical protein